MEVYLSKQLLNAKMKISKISIKNYRSCISTVFEPHDCLSALIGPNGSGKTNVLSALKLLAALCRHRQGAHEEDQDILTSPCELKTWYVIDGKTIIHTAKLNLVTNEKNQDEIVSAVEEWNLYEFTQNKKKVKIRSWYLNIYLQEKPLVRRSYVLRYLQASGVNNQALNALGKVVNFIGGIKYYSASQFTNPGNAPISFEVETDTDSNRRTGISITGHKRFLYDLYQETRTENGKYGDFLSLVGEDGIGLVQSIDFKEIITSSFNYSVKTGGAVLKKEKTNLLVVPSFEISGNNLSPSQLSEGTFKTLALIFYLVTDKGSSLLIEEPEVCVHHGLLSSIVELIKVYSQEKQIFISTHSSSVLDKLEVENVFKVRRENGLGTSVTSIQRRLKVRELNALNNYLENEGSLGEYWQHGDLENV